MRPFNQNLNIWDRLHIDLPLLIALLSLMSCSLVVLYSAGGQNMDLLLRQATRIALGLGAMLAIAQIAPRTMQSWALPVYLVGVALLVAVIFFGVSSKGAQRWLNIGIRFQPSEIMKLAMPVMVAWYISRYHLPPKYRVLAIGLLIVAIPTRLIMMQPDLGTSILIASSGLFVLFFAGLHWRLILTACALAPVAIYGFWQYGMHGYQKVRVLTMLDPESDPLGAGYHIIQSKIAIGSGGIEGKGWMQGTQSQLEFLPERHTDFIFSVLSEEFGLIGVMTLLALYFFIIARGLYIAINAQEIFGKLLAASITLTFFVYIFVNIGMVSGLLPVVGVPLPLISYGGTSMVTLLAGFGIIMSVATHKRRLAK